MTFALTRRISCGLLLAACCPLHVLSAQAALPPSRVARFRPVIRADAIVDRDPGAQLALGLAVAGAFNVRIGLDVGAGGVRRPSGAVAAGRVDLIARVLSDPFRKSRWALSGGGGIGQRFERGGEPRTVAIVALGLDGPSDGTWVPGVEIGLGGGVRVGFALRRAPRSQR